VHSSICHSTAQRGDLLGPSQLWANCRQLSYKHTKKAIAEILGDESVAMAVTA